MPSSISVRGGRRILEVHANFSRRPLDRASATIPIRPPQPAEVQFGGALRYILEPRTAPSTMVSVCPAWSRRRGPQGVADDHWKSPCWHAPPLRRDVRLPKEGSQQRAKRWRRGCGAGSRGVADVRLLLQSSTARKKYAPWATTATSIRRSHAPSADGRRLCDLTEASRRPRLRLSACDLQRTSRVMPTAPSLSSVSSRSTISLPQRATCARRALVDRDPRSSSFVLAGRRTCRPRRCGAVPSQGKIARSSFRDVNVACRNSGAAVALRRRGRCRSMPGGPNELDRNSAHWKELQSSGGFAIHLSGEFPNLNIELWAIRG